MDKDCGGKIDGLSVDCLLIKGKKSVKTGGKPPHPDRYDTGIPLLYYIKKSASYRWVVVWP